MADESKPAGKRHGRPNTIGCPQSKLSVLAIRGYGIRGLSPFPGAWFELGGQRIKALNAVAAEGRGEPGQVLDDMLLVACGDGAVRLTRLQRAGKGAMTAEEFQRGAKIAKGERLS